MNDNKIDTLDIRDEEASLNIGGYLKSTSLMDQKAEEDKINSRLLSPEIKSQMISGSKDGNQKPLGFKKKKKIRRFDLSNFNYYDIN